MMIRWRQYLTVRVMALLLFAALNLLDAISTQLAITSGLHEGNLLPSLLLARCGLWSMYAFKAASVIGVALVVLYVSPRFSRVWYGIHVSNLILAAVVAVNLAQLLAT